MGGILINFLEINKMVLCAISKKLSFMSAFKSTRWRFLTNYARVLVYIDRSKQVTVREISDFLGIAEPSVRRIIDQLTHAGYIDKQLVGRVNRYRVMSDLPLKAPEFNNIPVRILIESLNTASESEPSHSTSPPSSLPRHAPRPRLPAAP
jgi:hypothetical protein